MAEPLRAGVLAARLTQAAAARAAAGTERRLQLSGRQLNVDGPAAAGSLPQRAVVDLAGNDYVDLAGHPEVVAAAVAAVQRWGAGAGASRLVTGHLPVHEELELALAAFLQQPGVLVLSTGYHANLAAVTALAGRGDLVVSDAHVHASLVDACRLSRADVQVVAHNDLAGFEQALRARGQEHALVLVESVYSVLGDAAPLPQLAQLCERYGAVLLVDEAHALGTAGAGGQGLVAEHGLAGRSHVVLTGTLSKSLGAQGGFVAASAAVREHLINTARPFIYDTALAPAAAAGAGAALQVLRREPHRVARVRHVAAALAETARQPSPAAAVLSIPMTSAGAAREAADACVAAGVRVGCFRPPSVPDGISRLRLSASARLDDDTLTWVRAVLARFVE